MTGGEGREGGREGGGEGLTIQWIMNQTTKTSRQPIPSSFWILYDFLLLVRLCQVSFLIKFLCYTTQVHTLVL